MKLGINMKRKKITKELFSTIIYLLIIIAFTYLFITFVGQWSVVDGQSMENSLQHGDNIIIDKISYRFNEPKRFDIIVFPHLVGNDNKFYIKRIIGLPGETVYIDSNGDIYTNNIILEDSYGKEHIQDPGIAKTEIQLGVNEYFVLGDNRNHSSDSRDPSVGIITHNQIIGRAIFRIYPFNKIGIIIN